MKHLTLFPRFSIIKLGTIVNNQNLVKPKFTNDIENKITLLVVISIRASTSTYLVKFSITIKMNCLLLDALKNKPVIFIIHYHKGRGEKMTIISIELARH
jgi:hypothetical protein